MQDFKKFKKENRKKLYIIKTVSVFQNLFLSIGISWKASKLLFITRIFFEIIMAGVPILLAYIIELSRVYRKVLKKQPVYH
jgi:hypothetical protein